MRAGAAQGERQELRGGLPEKLVLRKDTKKVREVSKWTSREHSGQQRPAGACAGSALPSTVLCKRHDRYKLFPCFPTKLMGSF